MYRVKESDLKEVANSIEKQLREDGFDVEAKPYFAYGKYGYYFNFNQNRVIPSMRQIKVGLGTKKECLKELHTVYSKVISNKSYYMGN